MQNNCKSCQIYLDLQHVFSKSIECITNKILLLFSLNNNNISMYVADRENTTNLKKGQIFMRSNVSQKQGTPYQFICSNSFHSKLRFRNTLVSHAADRKTVTPVAGINTHVYTSVGFCQGQWVQKQQLCVFRHAALKDNYDIPNIYTRNGPSWVGWIFNISFAFPSSASFSPLSTFLSPTHPSIFSCYSKLQGQKKKINLVMRLGKYTERWVAWKVSV